MLFRNSHRLAHRYRRITQFTIQMILVETGKLGELGLRNEVHDVADLLRRAITARPEQERRLLSRGFLAPADSGDRRS